MHHAVKAKDSCCLKNDYDDKKGTTTAEASAIELSNRHGLGCLTDGRSS